MEVVTAPRARLPGPLDLSMPSDMLSAAARQALHALVGGIPGLSIKEVVATRASAKTTCVTIEAAGWSPTLHEATEKLVLKLPAPPEQHVIVVDEITGHHGLRRFAQTQVARAAAGLALGIPAPMDPTGGSVAVGPSRAIRRRLRTEMRHLLVDASLPAVLATAGEDPLSDLSDGLRRMHGVGIGLLREGDAEGVHRDGDIWLQEVGSDALGIDMPEPVTLRIVGRAAVVEVPEGMTGSYDGRHLRITGHGIPQTVATAMPGMRLGDVIRLHPALDERTVATAEIDDDEGIRIGLVTDLLPLPEAVQMTVDAHAQEE